MGFRPDLTGRHLCKVRTGIVALALPELGASCFAEPAAEVVVASDPPTKMELSNSTGFNWARVACIRRGRRR
ncbi:hypothetical protein [Streptomyces misionensis]